MNNKKLLRKTWSKKIKNLKRLQRIRDKIIITVMANKKPISIMKKSQIE